MLVLLLSGCVLHEVTGDVADLRQSGGLCGTAMLSDWNTARIESCLQLGMPGTLYDEQDGDTPRLISTVFSSSIELADPSAYQVTVERDGRRVYQAFLSDADPHVSPSGGFYAVSSRRLPYAPKAGEVWTAHYVAGYNTELERTVTFTFRP